MFSMIGKRKKQSQAGQALVLVLVLLALGSVIVTSLLGFIAVGAKTGTVYDKKNAELYAADAGIQDAVWQIRNQQIGTTCPTYNRYDFRNVGWSYDIPPVNSENVHVQLWNMWMFPTTIVPQPVTQADVTKSQGIATGGKLIVTGNTIMPVLTANDGVTTIYEYDVNIAYNPGATDLKINDIGIWFPPGFSLFPDETGHKCSLDGLTGSYANTMTEVSLAGNNCWYWVFPGAPTFINFPGHTGTAPSTVTLTIKLYFKPPQDQSTPKPDAVAWIKTSGNTAVPYAWDASTTIIKTTATAKKGSDVGTTIDSYMSHSELPQMQTAQAGDYIAIGKTMMSNFDNTVKSSNQRELLLTHNSDSITSLTTDSNVEAAYLYWDGWLHEPAPDTLGKQTFSVAQFYDNCNDDTDSNPLCAWQSKAWGLMAQTSWSQQQFSDIGSNGTTGGPSFYWALRGNNSSQTTDSQYLAMKNPVNLTGVTSAYLEWQQSTTASPSGTIFSDSCSNANFTNLWTITAPTDWSSPNGKTYYQAKYTNGSNANLTVKYSQPLAVYANTPSTITLSFMVWTDSGFGNSNGLNVQLSTDGGTTFTPIGSTFISLPTSQGTAVTETITIPTTPTNYLTNNFKMRFQLASTNLTKYCYIDNISLSASSGLYFQISKDNFSTYQTFNAFQGALTATLPNYSEGANVTPSYQIYTFAIPATYLGNANFKLRFYLSGFTGASDYVYLDNITVMVNTVSNTAPADTQVTLTITTNDGTNKTFSQVLNADQTDPNQMQSVWNTSGTGNYNTPHDGCFYACRVDVTGLVKGHSNGANLTANPQVIGDGNATYDVAGVYSDTCEDYKSGTSHGSSYDGSYGTSSFAGWSLVIIYSSPQTLGHQLYLYDLQTAFQYVGANQTINLPITGFIIPQQTTGEKDAATLTTFVGEGDWGISGDYVAFIDQHDATVHKLWDGTDPDGTGQSSLNNVFNGRSTDNPLGTDSGIDLDTFHIRWNGQSDKSTYDSNTKLLSGDTSGTFVMSTQGDTYLSVYVILSIRSKITTGGSISYLIRN
jgi:hypothetical protein